MSKRDCRQAVVSALESEGIEYVFGMPGTAKIFYSSPYDFSPIISIYAQEQSSDAFKDMEYACSLGKHCVCCGSPDPRMIDMKAMLNRTIQRSK